MTVLARNHVCYSTAVFKNRLNVCDVLKSAVLALSAFHEVWQGTRN